MTGLLLAIFLGQFGAYRFYKKQYGLAILYFFTLGIFGIGWLIDIICSIIDIQKEEENGTKAVEQVKQTDLQAENEALKRQLASYEERLSRLENRG